MIPTDSEELEINLLLDLSDEPTRLRQRQAALTSVLVHVVAILTMLIYSKMFPPPKSSAPPKPDQHITLLFPTPRELTQKDPNRAPRSKLFVGEPAPVRPPLMIAPNTIPALPGPNATPPPKGDLGREEPPLLTIKPELAGPGALAMTPAPAPAQAPKLALEDVNKSGARKETAPGQLGQLAQQRPGSVIEDAVRDLSHQAGKGGAVVGDATGGAPEGFTLPSRGNAGSNLEMLSDPMGVDFKPYLTRILATVRRNWYAVIPESARLGMIRGRVAIQFIIVRQGGVSKLVIATASGHEALDRAAVAGISASNPFPPLPSEFRGDQIKLQFTFLYNIAIK